MYQVWGMARSGTARLLLEDESALVAQREAEHQMHSGGTTYVYIKFWPADAREPARFAWDSLSGWYVQSDRRDAIRNIVQRR